MPIEGQRPGPRAAWVRLRLPVLALTVLLAAAACGGSGRGPSSTATADIPDPIPLPAVTTVPSPDRLASHIFLPVGRSRSLSGLGTLLEIVDLTDPPAVRVVNDTVTAVAGGVACLRFRYRDTAGENQVQTMCVVAIDEAGDCEGLPDVEADLDTFLAAAAGNADLLESGDRLYYAVCETAAGAYRLDTNRRSLPPPYLVIVDALTEGPYSLGDDETAAQRRGAVTTFGGEEIQLPWIVTVSGEIQTLALTDEGELVFNDEDCATVPSCTYDPAVIQPGDLLRVSFGIEADSFDDTLYAASGAARDRFFRDRIGMSWEQVGAVHPDGVRIAFARLVSLDVMGSLLSRFDRLYGLREAGIRVGYQPYWLASAEVVGACFPDGRAACGAIEDAIARAEARAIARWRAAGYRLWWAGRLDYDGHGPRTITSLRPSFELFEGVAATFSANSAVAVPDVPAALREVISDLAASVGPETPVILTMAGPPITSTTGGEFCEADICPSDFAAAFAHGEAVLDQASTVLTGDQFVGFGIALFDGSHFDIRHPYEDYGAYMLNRVGETGYNDPILNIWRAD